MLLEALAGDFLEAKDRDAHDVLVSPDLELGERLRPAVWGFRRGRYLLVIDNFEWALDEDSRAILIPSWPPSASPPGQPGGGSRSIVTCRSLPADLAPFPALPQEDGLGESPEPAFDQRAPGHAGDRLPAETGHLARYPR